MAACPRKRRWGVVVGEPQKLGRVSGAAGPLPGALGAGRGGQACAPVTPEPRIGADGPQRRLGAQAAIRPAVAHR